MAKEDLLRHELGRLEIEPIKIIKSKKLENPFLKNSKRSLSQVSAQNTSCSCTASRKNGVCKKKQNKILQEPVLQILKTQIGHRIGDKHVCQEETTDPEDSALDPLNLCTLVKTCNQLKISNDLKTHVRTKSVNDKAKWWKNEIVNCRDGREQRQSSQAGSCSQQALNPQCDITIDELASYFETLVHIPKKMSSMAEMMYI